MYIDFMGTDAAIFRSLTVRNAVRTDQHNSKWLSGDHARRFTSKPIRILPRLTRSDVAFRADIY